MFIDELTQKINGKIGDNLIGYKVLLLDKIAVFEGCKTILYYDKSLVKLNTGKKVLILKGEDLTIASSCLDEFIVKGNIQSFEVQK